MNIEVMARDRLPKAITLGFDDTSVMFMIKYLRKQKILTY